MRAYTVQPELELIEGIDRLDMALVATLYRRAPLHRSVGNPERLWQMFESSSYVVSAWSQGRLLGLARVLSDGGHTSVLCDLAVEPDVQGLGIGARILDEVYRKFEGTYLLVSDHDLPSGVFERAGFTRTHDVWRKKL